MRSFPRVCGAAGVGEVLRCYQPSHDCAGSDNALGAIERRDVWRPAHLWCGWGW